MKRANEEVKNENNLHIIEVIKHHIVFHFVLLHTLNECERNKKKTAPLQHHGAYDKAAQRATKNSSFLFHFNKDSGALHNSHLERNIYGMLTTMKETHESGQIK